jgi:hypothetical protein
MFQKLATKLRQLRRFFHEHGTGTTLPSDPDVQKRKDSKEHASHQSILGTGEIIVSDSPEAVNPAVRVQGGVNDHARRDLWKAAFEKLDDSQKRILQVPTTGIEGEQSPSATIINQVIEQTKGKYDEYKKGGFKIKGRNGKSDINVRDKAYKILDSALSFQSLVGAAVTFDPTGHGSHAHDSSLSEHG